MFVKEKEEEGQVIRDMETNRKKRRTKGNKKEMVQGIPDLLRTGLAGESSLMPVASLGVKISDDDDDVKMERTAFRHVSVPVCRSGFCW